MTSSNNVKGVAPQRILKNQAMDGKQIQRADPNYWAQGYVPSASGMAITNLPTGGAPPPSLATPAPVAGTQPPPAAAPSAPTFPPSLGSELINSAMGNLDGLADACQIRGNKDIKHFKDAMTKVSQLSAKASIAQPGQNPTTGELKLTAAQIDAIKNAATPEEAKKLVLQAISQQTGVPVNQLDPTHAGKKGNRPAREALNALLGTKIKDGREKNAGSAMMLDAICESVAKSVRGSSLQTGGGARAAANLGDGVSGPGGDKTVRGPEGPRGPEAPRNTNDVMINVGDFTGPAGDVGEMASPLIFDLAGTGLKIKEGEMMEVDIDGDGKEEVITNLDKGIGLLVFDSKTGEVNAAAGRDYFGDKTDLTVYGVHSQRKDRHWDNGFDALRALAEHFELVREGKQYLDAKDLAFLEKQVGLRMRIEGLRGADRTFAEVRVARINLGDPKKIQSMRDAQADAFGNKLMKQAGATFVVGGKTREYADIWFNVQARAKTSIPKAAAAGAFVGAQRLR